MMTLIIGGSGSGKSSYAETYMSSVSEGKQKYYIATMQAFDEEGKKKVQRHKKQREGKRFHTIEQPLHIENALRQMSGSGKKTALLECMSNLVANEMFSYEKQGTAGEVAEKIIDGTMALAKELDSLVIVSNNVFEDGRHYDETTMEYIKALGKVNERLAVLAENVTEVVVGIPIVLKKEEKEGKEKRCEL